MNPEATACQPAHEGRWPRNYLYTGFVPPLVLLVVISSSPNEYLCDWLREQVLKEKNKERLLPAEDIDFERPVTEGHSLPTLPTYLESPVP